MLSLLLACAWISADDKEARRDGDGDGYASVRWGGEDCDDSVPEVHPAAAEVCNGVDDDCSGAADDVPDGVGTAWYADSDGDGVGTAAQVTWACSQPEGTAEVDGDCNDTDVEVLPGAGEVCDGIDNDCDGAVDAADPDLDDTTFFRDVDGDGWGTDSDTLVQAGCTPPTGYVLQGGDCDDANPAVSPEGNEVCNGIDDDCDGAVDDDDPDTPQETWYADLDADGYGDPSASIELCAPPAGYLSDNTDCDDARADVFPGAQEVCDEVDQDCDGDIDDDAIDEKIWYADTDNDTWGDEDSIRAECAAPSGYVARKGDCDDTEATTYPGAAEECGVGVDSNCDGATDGDNDSDGYLACEDCDDSDKDINPGATEVCDGVDNDCDSLIDDADSSISSYSQSTWYGDADSDGYGDSSSSTLACDQPSGSVSDDTDCDDTSASINPGMWEICNDSADNDCDGNTDTQCNIPLTTKADHAIDGISNGDQAGASMAVGRVNSDGTADLVVGAPGGEEVYVFYGPITASSFGDADATWSAASNGDGAGAIVRLFDTSADGKKDLAVSAPGAGQAYVVYGPPSSSGSFSSSEGIVSGSTSDGFADSLAVGFNDGDGYEDLLVGAPATGTLGNGEVWLVEGPVTGSYSSGDATLSGSTGAGLGTVLGASDTDGDGQDESFVAAGPSVGNDSVWIFSGITGSLGTGDSDARLTGGTGDTVGALGGQGDVNGDGNEDLIIGADAASSGRGKVYLFLGPVTANASFSSADVVFTGPSSGAAGASVALVPDVNGDGTDEVLIGGSTASWMEIGESAPSGAVSLGSADLQFKGLGAGGAVAGGDLDGDGDPELVVGDTNAAGAVYLLYGSGF